MDFKEYEAAKLVDEYADLISRQKAIKDRLIELKAELIALSKQEEIERVYGSNMKVSVKEYQRIVYPEDKTELINALREKGLYDGVSMLHYPRLNSRILAGSIDEEISNLIQRRTDYRLHLSQIT